MENPVPGASRGDLTCGAIGLSLTDFARVVFPSRGLNLLVVWRSSERGPRPSDQGPAPLLRFFQTIRVGAPRSARQLTDP
jgi:hypothetical protein